MGRPKTGSNLSIAQLEDFLNQRRMQLDELEERRSQLQGEMEAIDRQIEAIGGTPGASNGNGKRASMVAGGRGRTASGRARNEKSLPETLEDVLRKEGTPMKVGQIVDAVLATGYRSTSDNFRAIINQTLIKERKRFVNSGERGTYALKKA